MSTAIFRERTPAGRSNSVIAPGGGMAATAIALDAERDDGSRLYQAAFVSAPGGRLPTSDLRVQTALAEPTNDYHLARLTAHLASERSDVPSYDLQKAQLFEAVSRDDSQAIAQAIRDGAMPDARDERGTTALEMAVALGHQNASQALLKAGADPNSRGYEENTPLHTAVVCQQPEIAKQLLEAGTNPYLVNARNQTPERVFQIMRESRLITDERTAESLSRSLGNSHLLSSNRAAVTAATPEREEQAVIVTRTSKSDKEPWGVGLVPLREALDDPAKVADRAPVRADYTYATRAEAEGAARRAAEKLELHYEDPHQRALVIAIKNEDYRAMRDQLRAGADPNRAAEGSEALPLHIAVQQGHFGVVRELIDRKADPNGREQDGWTPLMTAIDTRNPEMVELLIGMGADTKDAATRNYLDHNLEAQEQSEWFAHTQGEPVLGIEPDLDYESPPQLAQISHAFDNRLAIVISQGRLGEASRLLAEGEDPNSRTTDGTPCLQAALLAAIYDPKTLHDPKKGEDYRAIFEDKRVDIGATDARGRTLLHVAADYNQTEIIRAAIERGAKVNIADDRGMTALHVAAHSGNTDAMLALAKAGAELETRNIDGETPLHTAVREAHAYTVEKLLEAGANPLAKDAQGHTALEISAREAKEGKEPSSIEGPEFVFDHNDAIDRINYDRISMLIERSIEERAGQGRDEAAPRTDRDEIQSAPPEIAAFEQYEDRGDRDDPSR